MTLQEFHNYLWAACGVAAILGLINVLRADRRWLGFGALILSAAGALYALGLPTFVVAIVCGLGVFALARDIVRRSRRHA